MGYADGSDPIPMLAAASVLWPTRVLEGQNTLRCTAWLSSLLHWLLLLFSTHAHSSLSNRYIYNTSPLATSLLPTVYQLPIPRELPSLRKLMHSLTLSVRTLEQPTAAKWNLTMYTYPTIAAFSFASHLTKEGGFSLSNSMCNRLIWSLKHEQAKVRCDTSLPSQITKEWHLATAVPHKKWCSNPCEEKPQRWCVLTMASLLQLS